MIKKEDIKGIVKVGLILFAITAISALILAVVNNVTAPVIAANNAKKQAEAMQKVIPGAAGFSDENLAMKFLLSSDDSADKLSNISQIFEAKDSNGNTAGYAVMVNPNGYGGIISMVVGVSEDGTVTGVDIISQSETAGLGARCTEDGFKAQFAGKKANITVAKGGSGDDNSIDAISSATITSKAVTSGVNAAIDAVEWLVGVK